MEFLWSKKIHIFRVKKSGFAYELVDVIVVVVKELVQ